MLPKFKIKGSNEQLDELVTLIEKKDLTIQDVTLILSTIEILKNIDIYKNCKVAQELNKERITHGDISN